MSLRRRVAGNTWCAEKRNQGKYPCLACRGRGTVLYRDGARGKCFGCQGTGHKDYEVWERFAVWIYSLFCAYQFDERAVMMYNLSKARGGLCMKHSDNPTERIE